MRACPRRDAGGRVVIALMQADALMERVVAAVTQNDQIGWQFSPEVVVRVVMNVQRSLLRFRAAKLAAFVGALECPLPLRPPNVRREVVLVAALPCPPARALPPRTLTT